MPHRIQRACARRLDDEAAPFAFGAGQLDEGGVASESPPRPARKVLDLVNADTPHDRNAFPFHEQVVGSLQPFKFAESCALVAGGFMPMRLESVVHDSHLLNVGCWFSFRRLESRDTGRSSMRRR